MNKKITLLASLCLSVGLLKAQKKLVDNSTALVNGPDNYVVNSAEDRLVYTYENGATASWVDIATLSQTTSTVVTNPTDNRSVGGIIFQSHADASGNNDLAYAHPDSSDFTFVNYYPNLNSVDIDNFPIVFVKDDLGNYYGIGKFQSSPSTTVRVANRDFIKISADLTTVTNPFNNRAFDLGNANNISDFPHKNIYSNSMTTFAGDKVLVKAFTGEATFNNDNEFYVYDAGDNLTTQITDPAGAVQNSGFSNTNAVSYPLPQQFNGGTEVVFYHENNGQLSIYKTNGTVAGTTVVENITTYTLSTVTPTDANLLTTFATTTTEILWSDAIAGDDELYYSTGSGSTKVDINAAGSSSPRSIVANGDKALFLADVGLGYELYLYEGAGVYSQMTLSGNPISVAPFSTIYKSTIQAAGNGWIFVHDSGSGDKVYYTDGSAIVLLENGDDYLTFNKARDRQTLVTSEYFYFTDSDKDIFRVAIPDNIYNAGAFTEAVVDGQDHYFNGSYTHASGIINANSISVSAGNTLTVANGATVVVDDIYSSGSIVVEDGGSLVITGEVLGAGTVTATRRTTFNSTTGQYSVVGSPVTAATTAVLGTNAEVYAYDETQAYSETGSARFVRLLTDSTMVPGVGYFSAFTGDINGDITFTGTPNTGNIDVALSYSSASANDGYNLVANPYLGAISLNSLASQNAAAIDGNFYIWDDNNPQGTQGTNADYITVNSSGIVSSNSENARSFDGNIRTGQGFFVKATSASTLTFSPSQMVSGSNGSANFFRMASETFTRFKIAMESEAGYNETLLAFRENASSEFDHAMDGLKLTNGSDFQLFSYLNDDKYAIQTLHSSAVYDAVVKLGAVVPSSGNFTFKLSEVENMPEGTEVILVDKASQMEYNLSQKNAVELTLSANVNSLEIALRPAEVLSVNEKVESSLSVYANADNTLNVRLSEAGFEIANISIFNLSGKKLHSFKNQKFENGTWSKSVQLEDRSIYILRIDNGQNNISRKFLK